jgi:hypothetical protein
MFLWGRISSSKYLVEVIRALSVLCPVLAFIVAGYVVHSFHGAWFSSSLDSLLFSSFYSVWCYVRLSCDGRTNLCSN